jgi:hypothetical protein
MVRHNWLAALVLGVILLVVGYNFAQPAPLNSVEIIVGWVALVAAIILLVFGGFGGGGGSWYYGKRYR